MGFLARLVFWLALPATVVGVPAAFAWLALEREPLVVGKATLSVDDIRHAEEFWQRYDLRRIKAGQPSTVVATEQQINTAMRAGLAEDGKFKGRVVVDARGLYVAATTTFSMPIGKSRRYANLRAVFAPSPRGLRISRLQIGRLRMPPSLSVPILRSIIEIVAGPGRGGEFVDSVRAISFEGKSVSIAFTAPGGVMANATDEAPKKPVTKKAVMKKTAKKEVVRNTAAKNVARTGKPEAVQAYYTRLIELTRRQGSRARTSLTSFVQPLFRLAGQRSKKGNPIEENKAAILALSLYFGDRRIEHVAGNTLKPDMRRKKRHTDHVKLDGRHDFVRHFVVSAGLVLAGGAVLADAVGAAKEAEKPAGASGFSFTDLAADRAGAQFARAAVASRANAVRFQSRLSDLITEADIFPAVRDLPEGLSEPEFKRRYGNTSSRAYNRLVAEIDRRIGKIILYQ